MLESLYAQEIAVIYATGWTHDEYWDAPADLVDEIGADLAGQVAAARKKK